MRKPAVVVATAIALALTPLNISAAQPSLRDQAARALRQSAEFFRNRVSTEGGYHFYYSADLSYGRSEQAEGPTQVTVQRDGTPLVGMAYLTAYEATGDRFYLDAARDAALALVRGQQCNGGWDYIIEFDPPKRTRHAYRADGDCPEQDSDRRPPVTTLDDNVTQAAVRLMMRVDRELGFGDAKIHDAVLYALDRLVLAQYPNGAWPQRFSRTPDPKLYPVKRASYPDSWPRQWPGPSYRSHYTFNDNSISDTIDMMLEAERIYQEPKYRAAAERGGGFILLAQMPEPQPAWAQQYDAEMHPAWARVFEPPSVTGGESQGILKTLLVLYRETGDRKYLKPLPPALAYLQRSVVPKPDHPSEVWSRAARSGGPVLARFYELKTNRPLYITKGTRVSVKGRSTELIDGYQISYSDESVITHYGVLTSGREMASIAGEYQRIAAADPAALRRPEKLHGLSPWSRQPQAPALSHQQLEGEVRRIIAAMDERGAWVEEGFIGKSNRIVSVFAAKDMVVSIGGKVLPLIENETLELFQGPQPPLERIIRSRTFAHNIEVLSDYLTGTQ